MSTKAKSFKKNSQRDIRVAKQSNAAEAIGTMQKGQDVFILTYGQFSLIDAVVEVLGQIGPAHVIMSTWTAAHAHLSRSAELLASTEILSFRMIVDRSFKNRQPAYFNQMQELFGASCTRAIPTHAKFIVLQNNDWNIVIRTSMNLNENPRLENIEISDNADFADFFVKITDEVFKEIAPDEVVNHRLNLSGIPDTTNHQKVSCKPIKRSDLNEPKFSHAITANGGTEEASSAENS